MSRKKHISFLLLALLAAPAFAEVRVADDLGQAIALAQPARRIVSLAPHVTEMLFAAGAGDYLVGTVAYSDYPEAAKRIPRVGGYTNPDLEAVVGLRPDLIVAWKSGNRESQLDKLQGLGFTVYVTEPRHIEDVPSNIERLGVLAGTVTPARQAAARISRAPRRAAPALRRTPAGERVLPDMEPAADDGEWRAPHQRRAAPVRRAQRIHVAAGARAQGGHRGGACGRSGDHRGERHGRGASGVARRLAPLAASYSGAQRQSFFVPPELLQRHTPRILDGAERLCAAFDQARARR